MNLYLNCSPRLKESNTNTFLSLIKDPTEEINYLYQTKDYNKINISNYQNIILAFPLYVDSPPNKVIDLLEYFLDSKTNLENRNIYVIINCGFLEPSHNLIAKDIIKNFCTKVNANYQGSTLIGAGEVSGKYQRNKLYQLVSINTINRLKQLKKAINNNQSIELLTTIHPMSKKLYIKIANINFKKEIKKTD